MMKKQLLILTLLFCFSFQMMAQLKFDIEFGSNFSTSKFDPELRFAEGEIGTRIGYYIGLVPRLEINDRLNLSTSLQYSEEGFQTTTDDIKHRYQYLRLIPELELKIIGGLHLTGGVSFGYLLEEKIWFDEAWIDPFIDLIDEGDYGFVFGAKFRISRFLFSARYNTGVKNINGNIQTDVNGVAIGVVDQKNRTLQLGVGIRLVK